MITFVIIIIIVQDRLYCIVAVWLDIAYFIVIIIIIIMNIIAIMFFMHFISFDKFYTRYKNSLHHYA